MIAEALQEDLGLTEAELLLDRFSAAIDTSGWEVDGVREGGILEARVPIAQIYTGDVALDKAHVDDLAEQMDQVATERGGSGQLQRVLLATVIDKPGVLFVVDGFHRTEGTKKRGQAAIDATLIPNLTWEELLDHRIKTTSEELQSARIIDWAKDLWDLTPWSEKLGVTQAFRIYTGQSKGTRAKLTEEECAAIIEWVEQKTTTWGIKPNKVLSYLSAAEAIEPEIVNKMRTSKGFTAAHADATAKKFEGETEFQALIADTINERRISLAVTEKLLDALEVAATIEEAQAIIERFSFTSNSTQKVKGSNSRKTRPSRSDQNDIDPENPFDALDALYKNIEILRSAAANPMSEQTAGTWTAERIQRAKKLSSALLAITSQLEGIKAINTPSPEDPNETVSLDNSLAEYILNGGEKPFLLPDRSTMRTLRRILSRHSGNSIPENQASRMRELNEWILEHTVAS